MIFWNSGDIPIPLSSIVNSQHPSSENPLGFSSIEKVTIYLELQKKEKEQDRDLMNLPVLVVDDDKTCCESTIATLKEIGITGEWVLSDRKSTRLNSSH